MTIQVNHFRQRILSLVLLILPSLYVRGDASTQDGGLPSELANAIESNFQNVTSITLDWKLQRRSDRTIEELVEELGSKRYDFYRPEEGQCVVDGDKYFLHEKNERNIPPPEKNPGKFIRQKYTQSFDGKVHFHIGDDLIKSYVVSPLDRLKTSEPTPAVLLAIGLHLRTGFLPQSDLLWNLEQGGRFVSLTEDSYEGSLCDVVTLIPAPWIYPYWKDRQFIYYLDKTKGYSVARIDSVLPNGRLLYSIKNSDWQKMESPEIWLPKKSSCEWHTWHFCSDKHFDEVFFYEDFSIDYSRKEWPHSKFSPDLDEPGITVLDPRPNAKSKPGATWNESYSMWDYTNPPKFAVVPRARSGIIRWGLIGVIALLMVLLARDRWKRTK